MREGGALVSAPDRCGPPFCSPYTAKPFHRRVGPAATGREARRAAPNSPSRISVGCLTVPPADAAVRSARRSDQHLRPSPTGGPRYGPPREPCPPAVPTGRGPPSPTSTATNPHPSGGGTGNHRSVYKIGPRAVLYRSTDLPSTPAARLQAIGSTCHLVGLLPAPKPHSDRPGFDRLDRLTLVCSLTNDARRVLTR